MQQSTKNILAVATGIALIWIANVIGSFQPPFSITITPLLLPGIIAGINHSLYKENFPLTIAYNFGLLLCNDWAIRKYAGGIHDDEGSMWISFFFAIAFCLSVIIMLIYAVMHGSGNKSKQVGSVLYNCLTVIGFGVVSAVICAAIEVNR